MAIFDKVCNLVTYDLATGSTNVKYAKRRVARRFRIPARLASKLVKEADDLTAQYNPTLDV